MCSGHLVFEYRGEKKKYWFVPKQVTSTAERETVNVSRHTDVLGGARHRKDTGEPGLDIALHIAVKFCSLGLEGVLLLTLLKSLCRHFKGVIWRSMQHRDLNSLPVS